jgi:hypothetical protein
MKPAIRVDSGQMATPLPEDRLGAEELTELQRLIGEWERYEGLARAVKDKIQLLLLTAKDRRGITGPVEVQPENGAIVRIQAEAKHG